MSLFGARFVTICWPLLIGGTGLLVGSLITVVIDSSSSLLLIGLLFLAYSPGAGLTNLANQMAIYVQAPAEQIGSASGLMRTAQYLGAIIASGVIALMFGEQPSDGGLTAIGWVLSSLAGLLLALTVADRSLWPNRARPRRSMGQP